MFGASFYRQFRYKLVTHARVFSLSPNFEMNLQRGLFIVNSMLYLRTRFGFDNMCSWEKIKDLSIALPQTEDKEIDFAFMDNFVRELERSRVRELERSRVRELEAYLKATGLDDYELTETDISSISNYNNLQWKEFRIGDLFERISTKKLSFKAKDLPSRPTNKHILPCLTSSFMNQGLNYYVPKDGATILNNVISIPSNSDIYRAYYQSRDFTVLSDAYAIRWKDEAIPFHVKKYLFMVACINKVTDLPIYSYKNKLGGWNVVQDKYITLPVKADGQPDFAIMEQLIAAVQKIVIADVAKYTEHRLDATRQIIKSNQLVDNKIVELNPYAEVEFDSLMAADSFECYKWEGFDKSIRDFFGENQTILVGCYKGKDYQNWIHSHAMYNTRLGKTKGSMEANRELFESTSLLVLYELGKPDKLSAFKITGHHEISKEELIKLNYPNKKPRKSYMAFDIVPFEKDLTFLVEHHLIERLVELNANNAKGTPVFIEP